MLLRCFSFHRVSSINGEEPRWRQDSSTWRRFLQRGNQTRLVLRWVKVIPLVAESGINATHRRDWLPNAGRNMQMSRDRLAPRRNEEENGTRRLSTFLLSSSFPLVLVLVLASREPGPASTSVERVRCARETRKERDVKKEEPTGARPVRSFLSSSPRLFLPLGLYLRRARRTLPTDK